MKDKRFYWIKLRTDFFKRDDIDFLLSQPNGCQYVVLYQMLCNSTANNEGKLQTKIGEIIIPYNAEKIVRDCRYFDIDTVNIAMGLYKKLNLIYEEEDGTLRISNYDEMVGSEGSSAKRVREYRERKKLLQSNTEVTQDVTQEIDIDNRDKIKDNKKLDIKIEKEKKKKLSVKTLELEFEEIWKIYPNKQGKQKAFEHYQKYRNAGTTYEEVMDGLNNYLDYIEREKVEMHYIKHGSTWFNQQCWNDEYVYSNKKRTLKDISMAEIDEAIRLQKERSGMK